MRRTLLVLSLPVLLLLLPSVAGAAESTDEAPFPPSELGRVRQAMVRVINRERLRWDLAPLTYSPLLEQSAQGHADDMYERNYLSHRTPEGKNSEGRIRDTGYLAPPCQCSWSYATGENVAWGQTTIREVMKDWMNSASHRANILNPNFTEVGIGIEDVFWVQNFGSVQTVARRPSRAALNARRTSPIRM